VPVLIGAGVSWCGLPTGVPCAAGAKGDGGGGMWVECSGSGSGAGGIECRHHREANARERQEVKARWRALHGDEEVAAGDGSGASWRAREKPPGERKEVGIGRR
jgi:hypothetical protein